jgi:hypothetical protein
MAVRSEMVVTVSSSSLRPLSRDGSFSRVLNGELRTMQWEPHVLITCRI